MVDLFVRLERAIETAFEGLFSHGFRGRVQPVEVARRLTRAMEDHKLVSVNQVFVPNEFSVRLHPDDFKTIVPFEAAIVPELCRHVEQSAVDSRYELLGKPAIAFEEDHEVDRGQMAIEARFVRREDQAQRIPDHPTTDLAPGTRPSAQQASLQCVEGPDAGATFGLTRVLTSIGRGAGNDVPLTDSSVSRSHAEIELQPTGYLVRDLGSKNGTLVNSAPVHEAALSDGDRVSVGATVLEFQAARIL